MESKEIQWDKLLKIKTCGRDDTKADPYHYPYEPTPYCVLERLSQSGWIRKNNVVVDYGCGKGRVDFFLAYQTRCHSIGIEYDERIFERVQENTKQAVSATKTSFLCISAEDYEIDDCADCFYFFNPFSVEILKSVMKRIITSYYENPRQMKFIFYYPSNDYISYLMNVDELCFADELDCKDLFDGDNERERIVLFEMSL